MRRTGEGKSPRPGRADEASARPGPQGTSLQPVHFRAVKIAIGSASKNAREVVQKMDETYRLPTPPEWSPETATALKELGL